MAPIHIGLPGSSARYSPTTRMSRWVILAVAALLFGCEAKKQNVIWLDQGAEKTAAVAPRFLPELPPDAAAPGEAPAVRLALQMHTGLFSGRDTGGLGVPAIYNRTGHLFPLSDSNRPQDIQLIAASLDARSVPARVAAVVFGQPGQQKFSIVCLPLACLDGSAALPASAFSRTNTFAVVYPATDNSFRIAYVDDAAISDLGAKLGFKDLLGSINQVAD